jgi:hypothetical protein
MLMTMMTEEKKNIDPHIICNFPPIIFECERLILANECSTHYFIANSPSSKAYIYALYAISSALSEYAPLVV